MKRAKVGLGCAVALTCAMGLGAAGAQAFTSPSVATLAATKVTSTTAQLNGAVNAHGNQTFYQFEWASGGVYDRFTAPIAMSGTNVVYVSVQMVDLAPGTTYHYRVEDDVPLGSSGGDPDVVFHGADQAFTTSPAGQVTVAARRLAPRGAAVAVPLRCASTQPCAGKLTLLDAHHRTLGSGRFHLAAQREAAGTLHLSTAARQALRHHSSLGARLAVSPTTGQRPMARPVRLG